LSGPWEYRSAEVWEVRCGLSFAPCPTISGIQGHYTYPDG